MVYQLSENYLNKAPNCLLVHLVIVQNELHFAQLLNSRKQKILFKRL